jgi:hypothetical protein
MVRGLLVIHPEVRELLHEIRKTDRLTAALIGQAIQHVIDGRGPDEGRPIGSDQRQQAAPSEGAATCQYRRNRGHDLVHFRSCQTDGLLVASDKSRNWRGWYEVAIPLAEARYTEHLAVLNDEDE